MTTSDVKSILEKMETLRRQLGKVKMDLSVGWVRMGLQQLEELEKQMLEFQRDIILRKTIQIINSVPDSAWEEDE